MRRLTLVVSLWPVVQGAAFAECAETPPAQAKAFIRFHKVYHFNGEAPSRVSDELSIWNEENGGVCFVLSTTGPNYHECGVSGVALPQPRGQLLFKDGNCTLTFQVGAHSAKLTTSLGWERMGRNGTCTAHRCGMFGEVESGVFQAK